MITEQDYIHSLQDIGVLGIARGQVPAETALQIFHDVGGRGAVALSKDDFVDAVSRIQLALVSDDLR